MKLAAALLLAVLATPMAEPRFLRFERALQSAGAAGQTCAVLDAAAFEHAQLGLGDLRLYDGASTETPYVLRESGNEIVAPAHISVVNAGLRGGHTVFDVEMPAATYTDLDLGIEGRDFLASVTAYGGASIADAHTRIGTFTVFDFTRQRLGRSTVLHLPLSTFRALHFEVTGGLDPARFTGLAVLDARVREPRFVPVPASVAWSMHGRDAMAKFVVPAHVPVDRLLFAVPAQPGNFSRDVTVEIAEEPDKTQAAPTPVRASSNLLRLHLVRNGQRIDEDRLFVDAPQSVFERATHWTVTIHNGDDLPLRFTGLTLLMRERALCYEAAAGAQYMLRYGDPALKTPRYDYARWFDATASGVQATLGPERANPHWTARPDMRPFTERYPWLLWSALVVVIGLLGYIAFGTMRRAGPSEKD